MSDVYWRIYHWKQIDKLTVVCMQDFDEIDYDENRFMTDKDGYRLIFWKEEEAIKWLNENVKDELIDPEYKSLKFNKERFLK